MLHVRLLYVCTVLVEANQIVIIALSTGITGINIYSLTD